MKKNKNNKEKSFLKIFGWIFLIAGILVFVTTLSTYLNWKSKENNYTKQYVYSSEDNLYYDVNNNKILVKKIYNTSDEIIELNLPKQTTAIMYCLKNNINECIYFDMDSTTDQGMLNPFMSIVISLFLTSMGLFFIINEKNKNKDKITSLSNVFVFFVCLFVFGIGLFVWQIYNMINYYNLKNDHNITTATIYSEIYNIGGSNDLYKPVSYYYVDNQKYIYVNDSYINGNLEDNIGKTFDLYYDKNNPNKVSKKENPVNFLMLIVGIAVMAISFPTVFMKKKIEKELEISSYTIFNK